MEIFAAFDVHYFLNGNTFHPASRPTDSKTERKSRKFEEHFRITGGTEA